MASTHGPNDAGESPVALTGHPVVDTHLAKVGTVTDVLFDDGRTSGWAVVKTGLVSGEHFVPLDHTYVDTNGRLVVPLNRADIKRAPRIRRDHVLTPEARRELWDYYGIAA